MLQPKLGQLCVGNEGRDAVHIAIVPVRAECPIRPASHVWLTEIGGARTSALGSRNEATIGVADPYLTETIETGEWFYLFLYPGTVTSLRHVWTHPAFVTRIPM